MDITKVKVYFSLFGDEFPIAYVTESLGVVPTDSYNKGDVIERSHKQNGISKKTIFRKETAWELGTDFQESYDVKEQMDQILEPLKNKTAIINQLKAKYKLECKLFIVINMENGETPGLYLDNEQIEFANSIKAEFDIDLYANSYKETFDD
ncbi:DUF4279 domain-containing protein [Bacillus sp. CMF21]|nr:DUF4279 domain-containing protein [Bacillus sp. CMF21]